MQHMEPLEPDSAESGPFQSFKRYPDKAFRQRDT